LLFVEFTFQKTEIKKENRASKSEIAFLLFQKTENKKLNRVAKSQIDLDQINFISPTNQKLEVFKWLVRGTKCHGRTIKSSDSYISFPSMAFSTYF